MRQLPRHLEIRIQTFLILGECALLAFAGLSSAIVFQGAREILQCNICSSLILTALAAGAFISFTVHCLHRFVR